MEVLKVLFVCIDQGARAQIAEHYFSKYSLGQSVLSVQVLSKALLMAYPIA